MAENSTPTPGAPQWLIDPSGQIVTVPKESVPDALAAQYTLASPEQIAATQRAEEFHAKYGGLGGEVKAGLAGAARGLTFGVSDVAMTASGAVDPETLRGLEEENPSASTAGEIAGIALPTIASALAGPEGPAAVGGAAAARIGMRVAEHEATKAGLMDGLKAAGRFVGKYSAPSLAGEAGDAARAAVALHGLPAGEIAARAATEGGFTFDPLAMKFVKEGFAYAPAKATETAVGEHVTAGGVQDFAREHIQQILNGEKLGGWHATEGANVGNDVLDMSRVTSSENAALKGAVKGQQEGIFDLGTSSYIPTPANPTAAIMRSVMPAENTPLNIIARKALAQGAGSAVETSAYALGHVVSEAALGDPNLTAESALSQVGAASLLGFGSALIGSGVWNLSKNLVANTGLKQKFAEWLENTETDQGVKALHAQPSMSRQLLAHKDIGEAEAYWKDQGLMGPLTQPKAALANAAEHVATMGKQVDEAITAADSAMAPEEMPRIASVITKAKMTALGELRDNPMLRTEANRFQSVLDDYSGRFEGGMSLTDLREMRQQVDGEINWAKFPLNGARNGYENALVKFRGQINDTISGTLNKIKVLPDDVKESYASGMKGLHFGLMLRDGAESGVRKAEGRAGLSLGDMVAAGLGGGEEGMRRVGEGLADDLMEKIPGGLGAIAGGLGGVATGAAAGLAVKKMLDKYGAGVASSMAGMARNLLDGAGGAVSGPVPMILRAETENQEAGYAGRLIQDAGRDGALRSLVDKTSAGISNDRQSFAHMMPDQVGVTQPATDVVQHATAIGNNPEKVAALAELERTVNNVRNRIDTLAGNAVRGTVQGHGEPVGAVPRPMNEATFEKRIDQARQLASNPEAMQNLLTRQTADWGEHAPATAQAMNIATVRAAQYLANVAPVKINHAPLQTPPKPSAADVGKFSRAWEAVSNPLSILKQATAGTLSKESVEAVRSVYPQLFGQMQTAVLDRITNHRGALPYRQRQMASMLLGMDVDGTMNPGFTLRNQQQYQKNQMQQQATPQPSPSRAGKVTLAQRSLTETQRRSAGVEES
jgi:hypothetical protein